MNHRRDWLIVSFTAGLRIGRFANYTFAVFGCVALALSFAQADALEGRLTDNYGTGIDRTAC